VDTLDSRNARHFYFYFSITYKRMYRQICTDTKGRVYRDEAFASIQHHFFAYKALTK
jgi:hypothetical protein